MEDDVREVSLPSPADTAITREEQALLWRSLERLPEEYREPMVLYYRNQESVAAIATAMGISEEAARQRLSRGRAMLTQRMEAIVHDGLRRNGPSGAFTIAVLAAIPAMTSTINAATLGIAAAKGTSAAKGAATLTSAASVLLGPVMGILGAYLGYRLGVSQTIAPEERRFIRRYLLTILSAAGALMLILMGLGVWGNALGLGPATRAVIIITSALLYGLMVLLSCFRYERRIREIRAEVLARGPEMQQAAAAMSQRWSIYYRSAWSFLGVPLVEINMGGTPDARPAVAKGWIAIGAKAYGLLFACGAIAIAPLSFGGLAIGVFTWGGFALGAYVWGGFAIGLGALGGVAVGLKAVGGCALGWSAAWGAIAMAHSFAQGVIAVAAHANDEVARDYFENDLFFRAARVFLTHSNWVWMLILVPILPILLRIRRNARRGVGLRHE